MSMGEGIRRRECAEGIGGRVERRQGICNHIGNSCMTVLVVRACNLLAAIKAVLVTPSDRPQYSFALHSRSALAAHSLQRMAMLPLANSFAKLPDEIKKKTETPHAFYQVGWSYGNEKLQGNKPDYAKGR